MEKCLVYPDDLDEAEQNKLVRVDALLNFFEPIAYLSECEEFLRKDDMEPMFRFWFELMQMPTHAILERYLLRGFESLQQKLNIRPRPVLLAVYGTLMHGEMNEIRHMEPNKRSRAMQDCRRCFRCRPLSWPSPASDHSCVIV